MLQNLLTILKAEGFTLLGAPDGTRGVELALKEKPGLILCDITMPGLDGFGVLERVRSNPKTASIPFVFLTARGERVDLRTGMSFGADDYLTKPVKVDDLLIAIRARLNRETQRSVRKPDSLQPPESPQDFLVLGLTRREADVLFWLIQGKGNSDIGTLLNLSSATVKKHLEHIFQKLGVENRTSAIMSAFNGCLETERRSRGPCITCSAEVGYPLSSRRLLDYFEACFCDRSGQ